LLHFFKGL